MSDDDRCADHGRCCTRHGGGHRESGRSRFSGRRRCVENAGDALRRLGGRRLGLDRLGLDWLGLRDGGLRLWRRHGLRLRDGGLRLRRRRRGLRLCDGGLRLWRCRRRGLRLRDRRLGMPQRGLLFQLADPRLQPVAVRGQLFELFLPLVDLAQQIGLLGLLLGKIGFGLAEPRRQRGTLCLGDVQLLRDLRGLVALGRRRRGVHCRRRLGLRMLTHLLGHRDDAALRRREIAVRGGDLVTQPS
jgi:hypothetical protein